MRSRLTELTDRKFLFWENDTLISLVTMDSDAPAEPGPVEIFRPHVLLNLLPPKPATSVTEH